MSGQINSSVVTAFSILELFSESRPFLTTQDVSRELGLNSVTAHRFLKTLEIVGALVSFQRGRYHLGFTLSELGETASSTNSLVRLIQPKLNDIAVALQETVLATTHRHGRTIIMARARSPRPYSMTMDVGTELEAYCTANGKLWLANLAEKELDQYLSSTDRIAFTSHTLTDETQLRAEIAEIQRRGYAVCVKEREEEISAVGVPVISNRGRMIAGISVFGPSSHFTEEFQRKALDQLLLAAESIKASMYGDAAAANEGPVLAGR